MSQPDFLYKKFDVANYEPYFEGLKRHFPNSKYQDLRGLMILLMKEAYTDGRDDALIRVEMQELGIEKRLNGLNLNIYDTSFVLDWKSDILSDVILSISITSLLQTAYHNGQCFGLINA